MVVSHRLLPTTFSERPSTASFPLQNYFYSLWHMLKQCKYLPQSAGSPCECISEPASSVSVSRFNSLSTSSASASTSSAKPSFNSRACMETSFVIPQNYIIISNTVCSRGSVSHLCDPARNTLPNDTAAWAAILCPFWDLSCVSSQQQF